MKVLILVLGLCVAAQAVCNVKRGSIPSAVPMSDSVLPPDRKLVVRLDFNSTKGMSVPDSSGYANNGFFMDGSIPVHFKEGKCGNAAYAYCGDILFHGDTFQAKPHEAVTIAAWINLKQTIGSHSIFDTVGSTHACGQYHLEVNNGAVRWFHRNESTTTIFSCNAEGEMVKKDKWTHVTGTYDSATGKAKVYINGELRNMSIGSGLLSRDWLSRAGIGDHKSNRPLMGFVDEFRIYNYALNATEITALVKECGLIPPVVPTVVPTQPPPTGGSTAKVRKFADITAPIMDQAADASLDSSDDFLPLKKQPRQSIDSIEEAVLKRSHVQH